MELMTYGKILWRRFWIIAIVVGVVLLSIIYQLYLSQSRTVITSYSSTITLRIGIESTTQDSSDEYLLSAENIAKELQTGPILQSRKIADQIIAQIRNDQPIITQHFNKESLGNWEDPRAIGEALKAKADFSLVTITVDWETRAGSWAIANAIGQVLERDIGGLLGYENTASGERGTVIPTATIVNGASNPEEIVGTTSIQVRMLLLLILVATVLGIALAFLVDYLDNRIREPEEVVKNLQLPLYGEIPQAPTPGKGKIVQSKQKKVIDTDTVYK